MQIKGIVSPPVGWTVQVLWKGQPDQIVAAMVVARSEHGQVGLCPFLPGGGVPRRTPGEPWVRHVSDGHFVRNPQLTGVPKWQYVPGMEYQQTAAEQEIEDNYERKQHDARMRAEEARKQREGVLV